MSLRSVSFPEFGPTTNLGFGTTRMMSLSSTRERLGLLECAFDEGIRHFDTAPYYGYGEAERVLGEFVCGRRDQITITTKCGIEPPRILHTRWINVLVRRILKLFPFLRPGLSSKARSLSRKSAFTPVEARRSLDQSLTALKTDHVDLFLLHEPTFEDAASEELQSFLLKERDKGKIRAFGCGGDYSSIREIAVAQLPTAHWLQFEDNVLTRRSAKIRQMGAHCITFGTFKELPATLAQALKVVPERRAEWERRIDCDCGSEAVLAGLLQAASHARNPDGIVLFSTNRKDRIASAAKVASGTEFSDAQVAAFAELAQTLPLPQ